MAQMPIRNGHVLLADQGGRERDGDADDHAEEEDLDDEWEDGASAGLEERRVLLAEQDGHGNNPQNGVPKRVWRSEGGRVGVPPATWERVPAEVWVRPPAPAEGEGVSRP